MVRRFFKLVFLLLMVITSTLINAQTVGKIFDKNEADALFGTVLVSIPIKTSELRTIVDKTAKYVMFRIVSGEVIILDEARRPVYPSSDTAVGTDDPYKYYSKAIVIELLDKCTDEYVFLENRQAVFSITHGAFTLEEAWICPPICPEN